MEKPECCQPRTFRAKSGFGRPFSRNRATAPWAGQCTARRRQISVSTAVAPKGMKKSAEHHGTRLRPACEQGQPGSPGEVQQQRVNAARLDRDDQDEVAGSPIGDQRDAEPDLRPGDACDDEPFEPAGGTAHSPEPVSPKPSRSALPSIPIWGCLHLLQAYFEGAWRPKPGKAGIGNHPPAHELTSDRRLPTFAP
jgi:hypothetical protein